MTKKDLPVLVNKWIEIIHLLEEFRFHAERKSERPPFIPISTIERVLYRTRDLYKDISLYFVKGKKMPKEKPLERELRKSQRKTGVLVRENWRLEERLTRLRGQIESLKNSHNPKMKTLSKEEVGSSLFDCA